MYNFFLIIIFLIAAFKPNQALSQINFEWSANFGNIFDDISFKTIIDQEGNVIITGLMSGTIDFDPGSDEAWVDAYGGFDIFLAKFNSNKQLLFAKSLGSAGDDFGYSIDVDSNNNIYITGSFEEAIDFDTGTGTFYGVSNGNTDAFVAKYDPEGNFIHSFVFGGIGADLGNNIEVDSNDNVYIAGQFQKTIDFDQSDGVFELTADSFSLASFIVKYNSQGEFIFAKSITGEFAEAQLTDLTVDFDNNTLVTGYFNQSVDFDNNSGINILTALGEDIFIAKYDSQGGFVFAKSLGSEGNANTSQAIIVNNIGEYLIAGSYSGTVDFDTGTGEQIVTSNGIGDIFFAKYDATGDLIFVRTLEGMDDWEHVYDIALDTEGNIFITGLFENCDFDPGPGIYPLNAGNQDPADIYLAKYDSVGNLIYVTTYGEADYDEAYGIALDNEANVYITGDFTGGIDFNPGFEGGELTSNGYSDIFLVKFSQETTQASQPVNEKPSSLGISPNPTIAITSITSVNHFNNGTIIMTTATGEIAKTWHGQTGTNFNINFSGLTAGVYWLMVADETHVETGRVVVLR